MNKFYLVKFSCNWADEFDVHSVSVCDSVRYEHEKAIVEANAEVELNELYFGTNESFSDLTVSELYDCFSFVEISESTYNELATQFISTYRSGWGTWFKWPSEVLEDMDEDND